ncbi:MAG TPA: EamA family transporter [Candidatus Dormibacteraeota bacterium]|jgi:drug/metabolite transporter (DMT)-like permease|nr:EamA family transporter [Candidatus Dormibacteraeota bacterium]
MATGSAAAPPLEKTPTVKNVAAKSRALTFFAFFSIYFIWGSTYLAIRYAVETIPPLYTAGFRHLVAGSILLIWALAKGLRPTAKQIRASVVIGIFFFLIGHGTLHWAETRIPSGLASLIIAAEPIWVFLMASAVEKKWRMNAPLLAGVVLGLGGVALLLGHGAVTSSPGMFLGAVAVLVGAISWSAGIIYSRRSHLSGNPLLLSALSLLSGSVLLLTAGTLVGEARGFSFSQVTLRSWLSLAYLIVFGSVIAFTAYNWLLEHYSPTFVATHTYINPVVAVFLGWWLAGEKVTINVAIAAALVILAVFLVDRGMAKLHIDSNSVV